MEYMIKRLQLMLDIFFKVTTGVIFVTAVYIMGQHSRKS